MNNIFKRAAGFAALCGLLASCTPSGYYDSTGQYRSYGASDSFNHDKPMTGTPTATPGGVATTNTYVTVPAGSTTTVVNPDGSSASYVETSGPMVTYTQQGFYDRTGNYIPQQESPHVPLGMYPPQGMCRVWFPSRVSEFQPPVEACSGLQSRVPSGAYILYGG